MAEKIIGRLQTPVQSDGRRKDIHLITSTESVVTPNGQTLQSELESMQDSSGIVLANVQPTFPCTWFEAEEPVGTDTAAQVAVESVDIANTGYVDPGEVFTPVDSGDIPDPSVPAGEKYPEADGDVDGSSGVYDYWMIVPPGTKDALLIVSDNVTGDQYDPNEMIHISMVLKDIPNAQPGFYVKYYHVAVDNDSLYKINGGTANTVV